MNGYLLQILSGMLITLKLACSSFIVGMPLGIFGALLELKQVPVLSQIVKVILFFARGLPELLVLFFIYFGLAHLLNAFFQADINISPFIAGVVALSLIFGAYASQVFKSAFQAIDKAQLEAGLALGLSAWNITQLIRLPQAWRYAIPGLGNLWLILLKDTAIVSLIGLSDIMNRVKMAASITLQPFSFYLIAAIIYLIITSLSQIVINYYIKRENRYLLT